MKAGWVTKKLGDVTTKIGSGATPRGGEGAYKTTGISLIRSLNVYDYGFREAKLARIDDEQAARLANVIVEADDVLLNITGASVARCCLAPANFLPARVNQHVSIIRPVKGKFVPDFLHYLLISKTYKDRLLFTGEEGGSTRQAITKAQLQNFTIEYPESLPEQQRIVTILDEAFNSIATAKANTEKNLHNARALFESHLQSVFAQRGEGWADMRLGEICERVSVGHVGPTSEFYCDQSEGIPFLRSQNVRRGYLDWEGIQYVTKEFHQKLRKSQLQAGDLLFVRVGANRGDCCSLPNDAGEINCANIVFARPTKGNADYLARYCDSTHGREQLLGMTTGSAQGVINTHSVADLIVPIPLPSEQKRIVVSLNEFQAETQHLESIYQHKLAALDALKKSLLHQAFSGHL